MEAVRKSNSSATAADRMAKIELEAAEALAGLAHSVANVSESHGSETVSERFKSELNSGNSWFDPVDSVPRSSRNLSEDRANFGQKNSKKTCNYTAKLVKDEQRTELRLNPTYTTNYASSSGRKSRQSLTEAEKEARKIRRVLANRESARQTIRRRQAIYEELTRKAADLACENGNLKREKEVASKEYDYLKRMNELLKAQMIDILKVEEEEIREESMGTSNELATCSSSTDSPFIICNQPSFFPFVWPSVVSPPQNGILFPSHVPIPATNKPDSASLGKGNSMMITGAGSPLYFLPCPWLFAIPQNGHGHHPRPFNLNDKPNESSRIDPHAGSSSSKTLVPREYHQLFPENVKVEAPGSKEAIPANDPSHNPIGFPPDGGGQQMVESNSRDNVIMPTPGSCAKSEACVEHEDTNKPLPAATVSDREQSTPEMNKVPVVCSGKKLASVAAAAEARKRRKQLTKLKNLHCRLKLH